MKYKKLSIIIPVYNEEKFIETVINKVLEANSLGLKKEIIIVDDGSFDQTKIKIENKIKKLKKRQVKIKVIFKKKNEGKGAAVKNGVLSSTSDIVLIQDADLEYNPADYPTLLEPILKGQADVVYGSRFLKSEKTQHNKVVYKHGFLFSRFLNCLSNILSGVYLTDMYTCYKVFSAEALSRILPHLKSNRFGIDPELTAWAAKYHLRIVEVPISYKGRTYQEGKKINWKDGIAAIWHIIRFNIFTWR